MQLLLVVITFTETFSSMYMLSNIMLATYNITTSRKQKALFAVVTGTLLQSVVVYVIYLLGGMISFNYTVYLLTVNPNPVGAIIYYFSALWIFKLSTERSVKLMSYMFVFWTLKVKMGMLLYAMFFVQEGVRYNYLLDALQQAITLLIFFSLCSTVQHFLKKSQVGLRFSENMFFNRKKEMLVYFIEASSIFAVSFVVPLMMTDQIAANVIAILALLLFTVGSLFWDSTRYYKRAASNYNVHISTLFKGIEELRGIKHDFNNILHTYSGYLELREYERLEAYHASLISATSHASSIMELTQKMPENPPVIMLLLDKMDYAERSSVRMLVTISCSLKELYIDNVDLTRILSCLLDKAIAAAAASEQRKVYMTMESKAADSKLIIVTNSAASANGHAAAASSQRDAGSAVVRDILGRYGNCSYQTQYQNQESTVYVELIKAQ